MGVSQSPQEDWGLKRAHNWKLKFCWKPQKCFLTGKSLWGKLAYCGTGIMSGPSEIIFEDYWIERNEFIIWKLKQ